MDQNNLPVSPDPGIIPQQVNVEPPKQSNRIILLLSLFIILFIGTVTLALKPWETKTNENVNAQKPEVTQTTPKMFLSLTSPGQNSLAVGQETIVKGKTLPGSTVLVYTGVDDSTVESANDGSFETTVLLDKDSDTLSITAISPNGEEETIDRDINIKPEEI